ncbi:MAG: nucleotidyltransferase family protein [Vicinamibacterales bacterium]
MSLPIAILAGGLATRLRPITEAVPKSLVEVAGRPFAVHQLELLRAQGLTDVVWLVGYRADQLEAALGEGEAWGMRFTYVHDGPVLLGTGGAIRRALEYLGDAFFVMYGDSYLECDFAAVEETFRRSARSGLMTVYRNEGRFDTSNVEFANGRIVRYDKKARTPEMRHIDWGLGVLTARAFEGYAADEPLDLARVYQDLLASGDLAGYEVTRRFYEIGSPEGLAETDAYLRGRGGVP